MPEIQEILPKYVQVADHIRRLIVKGELKPGDEIPSERQIVEDWGVSRPTATRALAALRAEGLVEARQGSGTFVRERPLLNRRARDRYARSRESGRIYTSAERSEITDAGMARAPQDVAAVFGLERAAQVIRRRRVVYDPSGPVEVSVSWFEAQLKNKAPRLLRTARIREGTLTYVEQVTGRRGRLARDRVGARLATAKEKSALGLNKRAEAVLVIQHTVFDQAGRVLEFVQATYPPGRWSLEQEYPIPG